MRCVVAASREAKILIYGERSSSERATCQDLEKHVKDGFHATTQRRDENLFLHG